MSENKTTDLVFQAGAIRTAVDIRIYRVVAAQKAAYKFADRCTVVLGQLGGDMLPLSFNFAANIRERDALETARLFFQELLDQELRERLGEETRAIRSLLLAQAFSKTDLIRRE